MLMKFDIKNEFVNNKKRISIVLGALVLLIVLGLWLRYFKNQIHDLPDILAAGRITVVIDSTSIGFSVVGDNVSGFQYEIVKAFADSLGVELVVVEENDLQASIEGLKNRDYQIIADFIPVTNEWKNEVLFTTPLLSSHQVLVQRFTNDYTKEIAIKKQTDLANDTIYIPIHSPNKIILTHLSSEIADSISILELNLSAEQIVRQVANGKVKYTICGELFAEKLKSKYPNIDVSLPIGFEQQQAWAVNKKSPILLEKLNEFLDDFIGSSAYWEIYRKYY